MFRSVTSNRQVLNHAGMRRSRVTFFVAWRWFSSPGANDRLFQWDDGTDTNKIAAMYTPGAGTLRWHQRDRIWNFKGSGSTSTLGPHYALIQTDLSAVENEPDAWSSWQNTAGVIEWRKDDLDTPVGTATGPTVALDDSVLNILNRSDELRGGNGDMSAFIAWNRWLTHEERFLFFGILPSDTVDSDTLGWPQIKPRNVFTRPPPQIFAIWDGSEAPYDRGQGRTMISNPYTGDLGAISYDIHNDLIPRPRPPINWTKYAGQLSTGPNITDFGDEAHDWGEDNTVITGTNFG